MVFRFLRFLPPFLETSWPPPPWPTYRQAPQAYETSPFSWGKNNKKKNIVGYTSRTSWACVCLVGCDWCKCKKNTHHLYSFLVLIFHYLVETNAEVIFCCAVSLCLDADYLRRFRMFTSWRRPAKGGQGTPSMPAKSTWSPGCIQTTPANCAKAFVVWSKPITILKPNI